MRPVFAARGGSLPLPLQRGPSARRAPTDVGGACAVRRGVCPCSRPARHQPARGEKLGRTERGLTRRPRQPSASVAEGTRRPPPTASQPRGLRLYSPAPGRVPA
eukprot:CAMPEP_0198443822 /NCGR_PEP_ID=MMETSP1452-20131203/70285_1 /TAXON_ID=1181717 /ORGANISM="Synchroma pusillum, Strain CCMP3072" /LENGTH=103 /DNA_ID=CAMNT_0044164471 /DNA_START=3457 /DNA_END=3765 /DNA_ORIENTATION=+